jgi:GDP-L-fucose synthase
MREVTGYEGALVQDTSKPDGTPRKLLDVSRLTALGWRARISLRDGIAQTYQWFLDNPHTERNTEMTLQPAAIA